MPLVAQLMEINYGLQMRKIKINRKEDRQIIVIRSDVRKCGLFFLKRIKVITVFN